MSRTNLRDIYLEHSAAMLVTEIVNLPVHRVERLSMGVSTHTFSVLCSSGTKYVVRFYPPTRFRVVEYEPDLLRRCKQTGAKVPEVITDSRIGPVAELPYMVYKMIEGVPLSQRYGLVSPYRQEGIGRQLVESLKILHEIKFAGFGELIDSRRARWGSWKEFVGRSIAEGLMSVRQHRLLPSKMLDDLARVNEQLERFLVEVSPGLIWGDIGMDNIILDDQDRLAGLIDFEGALSGENLVSLGYCKAKYGGDRFYETILRAWPEPLDENKRKRIELYAILRALRVAPFAHEALPTGYQRAPLATIFPNLQLALNLLR